VKNIVLRTHPEVAKFLKSNTNDFLEEIESVLKRSVMVKSDPLLHQEKFDFAL
jgi:ribonuclease G